MCVHVCCCGEHQPISQCVVMAVTVGRELFITIRITYFKLKAACVLYHGVKTELDAVSSEPNRQYETQQGAAVKPGVCIDTTSSVDIFGVNNKILFPFI